MSTETDRKALALYPFDGSDPDTILALHAAFRAGAEFAAERAPAWDEGAVFGIRDQHGTVDTYIRDAIERHNPYREED